MARLVRRFVQRFGFTAAILAIAGSAVAADTLRMTLKQKVSVSGETILFSDIFNGAPADLANLAIAPSPAPGETVRYDAGFLIRAVRRHGLDWRPRSRFVETEVSRSAVLVTVDEALSAVADAIKAHGRMDGELEMVIESPLEDVYLPAGAAVETQIVDVSYDARSSRFRAGVILSGGGVSERLDVYGRAHEVLMIPTLARTVGRGERIAVRDLTTTPVRVDRIPPDAVMRAEQLVGMEVDRILRPGMVLRASDVARATMIERGSIVAIVFQTANMTLTSQGRALEDGATGATIRVSNTQTNRVVYARVIAPNRVRVFNAAQLATR